MDASSTFALMLDKAIRAEPDAFKDFDHTKNVQDQLQEMVVGTYLQKFGRVYRLVAGMELSPSDSMEQLWLAFVMREKFGGKVWDGETWQKQKTATPV